jgi:hypothetical protein
MKQYEYNVVTNDTPLQEEILNRLGGEGWSLSSHQYTPFPYGLDRHVYTFKREKVEEPVRKFKLDDSFKKRLEEVVVSDTPAFSWMDEYRGEYDKLLVSGMFFEWFPTFTGEWDKDKYAFCHDKKYRKK